MRCISALVCLAAFQTFLALPAAAQSQEERAARMAQEETERMQRQQAENAQKIKMKLIVESEGAPYTRNEKPDSAPRK